MVVVALCLKAVIFMVPPKGTIRLKLGSSSLVLS